MKLNLTTRWTMILMISGWTAVKGTAAGGAPVFYTSQDSFLAATGSPSSFGFNSLASGSAAASFSTAAGLTLNGFNFSGTTGNPQAPYYLGASGPNFYGTDYSTVPGASSLQVPAISSMFYNITNGKLTITMPGAGVTAFGLLLFDVKTFTTDGSGSDTVNINVGGSVGHATSPPFGTAFIGFTSATPVTSVTLTGTSPDEFPTLSKVYFIPAPPPAIPTITSVLNGAGFQPTIASGAWISIKGTNLSSTTRIWTATDFQGNNLPVQLDGVSAKVNNLSALVYYVSPTQLNLLAPDDGTTGPAQVEVTTSTGTSTAFTVTKSAFSPGLFTFTATYPAAVHLDGTYVGPAGLIPGAQFSPAKPGETLALFGTGFGPANPPQPASTIVTPSALADQVTVTIGGQPAEVLYAGLTGSGLVQLNVTVPPGVPNGDAALSATVGGTSIPSGLLLTIHN